MHLQYHDILRRVPQRPLRWLDGVPRYEPFTPDIVGSVEVALVHTECQSCGTRYDVAVRPRPPLFHSLRTVLAFSNSLEIGDPPFACLELGATRCSAGYCMSSLEMRILEFWCRADVQSGWRRDSDFERPLADAGLGVAGEDDSPRSIMTRIYSSERQDEWRRVCSRGDFPAMVDLLTAFGCERPDQVANMLDRDRRERLFWQELSALREERLGKEG